MKTININGLEYTVEELTTILENAKKVSPMQKVYEYHNTTEENFNKLYLNIPEKVKAYQQEIMIVSFYNREWKPDWSNNEPKYYPYFYMDNFRLRCVFEFVLSSLVGAPQVFKNKKDCEEAVKLFFQVYKNSRTI
jgi:hypothetical protein